ncbi:MAG: hypothetical protein ACYC1M_15845 [Armatimonadota bacterium]
MFRYRRRSPGDTLVEAVVIGLFILFMSGPYAIALLDFVFSTYLVPEMPQVMWGFWGLLIGATAGLQIVAPRMGLERAAQISRWSVPAVMLALAVIGQLIKR